MFKLSGRILSSVATFATDASSPAIAELIKRAPIVVFMKGVPEAPKCGFSNAVVQILRMHDVKYEAYNVLEDDTLRQGIKEFTQWPTIPQVFVAGEFVGGCDILLQMHQSGELIEELKKVGIQSALLEKAIKKEKDQETATPSSSSTSTETNTENKADAK